MVGSGKVTGRETKWVGRDIKASRKTVVSCRLSVASATTGSEVQQRPSGRSAPTVEGWHGIGGASTYESTQRTRTFVTSFFAGVSCSPCRQRTPLGWGTCGYWTWERKSPLKLAALA